MALIKCPECKREISSEALSCPHCGFPISKLSKAEEDIPRTIAIRGEPGSIQGILIFDFVIGIIFILGTVPTIIFSLMAEIIALVIFASIFGIAGIIAFAAGIQGFYRMSLNSKNTRPCIEYNEEQNKLFLYKINGEKITISPSNYISLKDNLFTDNLLFFTYMDSNGKRHKINLGYCANRDEIRPILEKLRNKHRF